MENGHSTGGANGMSLALGGNKSLTIDGEHLVLSAAKEDEQRGNGNGNGKKAKSSWTCCTPLVATAADPGGQLMIPLYNILWAEVSGAKLVIDYAAQPTRTSIKPDNWVFDVDASAQRPEVFASALVARAYGEAQPRKRAYVLVNPNAGRGAALRKWDRDVRPLFEAARMLVHVVTLARGGEAADLAEKVDVDKYDTIVACSGDGTPHEIFNGLARRPDATTALSSLAVSHVPCGSGNAMSCNLYGSHRPVFAALAIIKGVVTPLDLVSITQGDRRFVSFLSQALGIVAESDLATENLRWMGSARFEIGLITRLFRQRCYPCDLAVKSEVEEKDDVEAHYRRHATDAGLSKALVVDGQQGEGPAESQAEAETQGDAQGEGLPPLLYGTIQDKLPDGWELVSHDNMGLLYCGNMAYMAPDLNFFSAAVASDGCMDLVTINGNLSPLTAIRTLMSVEAGKFFDNPHVSYKKISAYRVIPRNQQDGYISIDGERVPFEPFQAEVHYALGRVISKRGAFESDGPANWDSVSIAERLHA